jgi:Holliday junction DNA helicase RuvA
MFEYLRGKLAEISDQQAVVEVGGIGYKLGIPKRVSLRLPALGNEVLLYVTIITRETGQTLYGFRTKSERDLFELLLSLNGIGPKLALSLMSNVSARQLHAAVSLGDAKALSSIPGIGKKTAERLLVELSSKLDALLDTDEEEAPQSRLVHDALKALLQLGFTQANAQRMVQDATTRKPQIDDLPTLLSEALRRSVA